MRTLALQQFRVNGIERHLKTSHFLYRTRISPVLSRTRVLSIRTYTGNCILSAFVNCSKVLYRLGVYNNAYLFYILFCNCLYFWIMQLMTYLSFCKRVLSFTNKNDLILGLSYDSICGGWGGVAEYRCIMHQLIVKRMTDRCRSLGLNKTHSAQ